MPRKYTQKEKAAGGYTYRSPARERARKQLEREKARKRDLKKQKKLLEQSKKYNKLHDKFFKIENKTGHILQEAETYLAANIPPIFVNNRIRGGLMGRFYVHNHEKFLKVDKQRRYIAKKLKEAEDERWAFEKKIHNKHTPCICCNCKRERAQKRLKSQESLETDTNNGKEEME